MNNKHLETWEAENASLHAVDAWLSWLGMDQTLTGLTETELDGDRSEGNPMPDPCCLDELNDWYRDGTSTIEASTIIMQRCREDTERRGIPALARLIKIAHGDTGQCGRVRRFLLGLYNGGTFPFDLTDLRAVDRAIQEDALAVLAMDMTPRVEVHHRIPGKSEIIATWAADAWPAENS
jgi:hypothetical protein